MAKLLPLLTAAVMIGVLGGMVLWLMALHRESVVLASSEPAKPAASVQAVPFATSAGQTAERAAGLSQASPAADEVLIAQSPVGGSPVPQFSESTLAPGASPSGVQPVSLPYPYVALGRAVPPPGGAPQPGAGGTIDDALTFALEAADPYTREGFTIREDYWGGDLPVKVTKAIAHQLFQGNTYWFWMGTDLAGAKISVHLYDSDGRLAEAESWQKPHRAAARVVPRRTGTYYLIVEVEQSPAERSYWALAYGFQ